MKIDQMREEITKAYSGPAWRLKVMGMSDRQVIAIYYDMKRKNRLGKRPHENAVKFREGDEKCEQLNMWDILNEIKEKESNE